MNLWKGGATLGGINALGASEGETLGEVALDTGIGAGLGAGIGYGAQRIIGGLAPASQK